MTSQTACLLLMSGGVESSVLAAECSEEYQAVHPVYVRQGLRWETTELACLQEYLNALNRPSLKPLTILDIPLDDVYGNHWSRTQASVPSAQDPIDSDFLPGRNIILLAKTMILAAECQVSLIIVGSLKTNPHPDSTPEFFALMSQVASTALAQPITIRAPFGHLVKWEVVRKGARLPLELTMSCIDPVGRIHCGTCIKCGERHEAFEKAGIEDPTAYASPPLIAS